jgi:hypothetical protein
VKNKQLMAIVSFCLVAVGLFGMQAEDERPQDESKFTFGRVYFDVPMGRWGPIGAGNGPPWSHDTPRSETHMMKIMSELTQLDPNPRPHVFSFQTDECFKYPMAYMCEVGYLDLSKEEAHRMAEYLLRGGFLIVDDFRGPRALENFKRNLRTVFPDRVLEPVPRTDPIWRTFFDISNVFPEPPYARWNIPEYLGMRDDQGHLMMIVNYNNDLSEYWEWADNSYLPVPLTNQSFKYGVNYIIYGLTH